MRNRKIVAVLKLLFLSIIIKSRIIDNRQREKLIITVGVIGWEKIRKKPQMLQTSIEQASTNLGRSDTLKIILLILFIRLLYHRLAGCIRCGILEVCLK